MLRERNEEDISLRTFYNSLGSLGPSRLRASSLSFSSNLVRAVHARGSGQAASSAI